MSLTFAQARDEMLTLFNNAWDSSTYPVIWDDQVGEKPGNSVFGWAKVMIRHTDGSQGSLTNNAGAIRWERNGIVLIMIYTRAGEGLSRADTLAKIAVDAYEGQYTPGGVWFRNVRINEEGVDGDWFLTTVTADFTYDEVK